MRRPRSAVRLLAALILTSVLAPISAHKNHQEKSAETVILAPGYQALKFDAPPPGSYALPIIKAAADGAVITHRDEQTTLHDLLKDRVGIISFIYTSCDDVNGCPLASFVLSKIDKRIQSEPALRDVVRLLSVSFDYETDSTAQLASYARGFTSEDSQWRFLRAKNPEQLQRILKAYDQSVVIEPDGSTISHILRVFLVDNDKNIRNVYSVSFLHADTLINDLLTLLGHQRPSVRAVANDNTTATADYGDYPTVSRALNYEAKNSIDLAEFGRTPQLGLPTPNNTATKHEINLGKRLFFDRRLSHNNTISCAMCHIPEQGFTSNELSTAVGIEGRTVRRNSPTLLNISFMERLFHDGRETSLEHQVWSPLLANNEMANPSIGFLIDKIRRTDDYAQLFEELYPNEGVSMRSVGAAIAAYERTLNAGASKVDELLFQAPDTALQDEKLAQGLSVFTGKGRCVSCHSIDEDRALFTDQQLHNTGIGYARSMGADEVFREVLVAPGKTLEVHQDDVGPNELDLFNDLGLYEITEDPADRWKYRTPSLRNVALTGPYMHDGSLQTLEEVIRFYDAGGVPNPELDPLIKPLGLSQEEQRSLVYFLRQLTSPHVETLVKDARSTPIGEPD
ncbi:MAG: cytochrome c peroxidase [Gammaproteobacteria bacterium]